VFGIDSSSFFTG